jgi:hypothetical protein
VKHTPLNQTRHLSEGIAMEMTTTLEIVDDRSIENLLDLETLTDEQLAMIGGGQGITFID